MWSSFSGKVMVSFYLNLHFYSDVGTSWMFRLLYSSGCYGRVCFWLGSVNLVDSMIQLILSLIQVFGGVERSWRWRSESSLAVGDLQGWRIDLEPRIPRWSAPSACFHKIDWMWIDYISVWGHVFVKIHCVYLLLKQKKITWVKTCFNEELFSVVWNKQCFK